MNPKGHDGSGRNGLETDRCAARSCKAKLEALMERCRHSGLRRTRTTRDLLHTLLDHDRPMTLNELSASEYLASQCDKTTLYRILQRLVAREIVRRLGIGGRSAYFSLIDPESSNAYLICTGCGLIETIPTPASVRGLEEHVVKTTGYSRLYHELEIYGVCPRCP